jgi:hypothetical protein
LALLLEVATAPCFLLFQATTAPLSMTTNALTDLRVSGHHGMWPTFWPTHLGFESHGFPRSVSTGYELFSSSTPITLSPFSHCGGVSILSSTIYALSHNLILWRLASSAGDAGGSPTGGGTERQPVTENKPPS